MKKENSVPSHTSTSRNFYHNFPRSRLNGSREEMIQTGQAILQSIKKIGLILVPEIVEWKQPLQDGSFRTVLIKQNRISFTELSQVEVKEHGRFFGPFAIEFSVDVLRKLGAMPVIYIPQNLKDDNKYSAVGSTIVAQLNDIKYTINQLHILSQLANPEHILKTVPDAKSISDDFLIHLSNTDPSNAVVQSSAVSMKCVNNILSYIEYRNAPFDLMVGVLSHIQNLFYPTDNDRHDSLLEYYRQREWRLLPNLKVDNTMQARPLTNSEKDYVISMDVSFWSKAQSYENKSFRRIDDVSVIDMFNGTHISELISSVIVPEESLNFARDIFGEKAIIL
jgi:hypothetical protein